jgi:hypothetical protein
MALSFKVLKIAKSTSTAVPFDVAYTGAGFQPKAGLFIAVLKSGDGFAEGYDLSYGFSDGTNHRNTAQRSLDAAATSDCGGATRNDCCISFVDDAAATIIRASVKQWDSDGFTLTYAQNTATACDIYCYLWGGSDITNVTVGTASLPTAAGNFDTTGLGYTVTEGNGALFTMHTGATTVGTAVKGSGGILSAGWAISSTKEGSLSIASESGRTTSDTWRYQRADKCWVDLAETTGAISSEGEFVSWISDGFTLNATTTILNERLYYMVIKGGNWDADTFNLSGTGNASVTSMSFTPAGELMMSYGTTTQTVPQSHNRLGFGGANSTTSRGSIFVGDTDAAADEITAQRSLSTRMFNMATEALTATSSTSHVEIDFVSHNSNGFTYNKATNSGTLGTIEMLWIAFGSSAALTRVEKQNTFLYNIVGRTSKQNTLKYHVIGRTSKQNTLRYNIRQLVSKPNTLRYNIIGRIKKPNTLRYNILGRVSKLNILRYNILARVSKLNTLRYNIRLQVSKSNTYKYNILGRISKLNTLRYNIIGRVRKPNTFLYRIMGRVSKPATLRYNILGRVSDSTTLRYNILGRTSKASSYLYNIRGRISKPNIFRYNIFVQVKKLNTFKYNILTRVSKPTTFLYNILAALSRVSKPTTYKYNIVGRTAKPTTYRYNVLQLAKKPITYRYNILSRISKSNTFKYNILQRVSKPNTFIYNLIASLARIQKAATFKYNIIARTSRPTTYRYSILNRISKPNTLRYNILSRVQKPNTFRYNILGLVSKATTYRYNIFGRISKQISFIYNILGELPPGGAQFSGQGGISQKLKRTYRPRQETVPPRRIIAIIYIKSRREFSIAVIYTKTRLAVQVKRNFMPLKVGFAPLPIKETPKATPRIFYTKSTGTLKAASLITKTRGTFNIKRLSTRYYLDEEAKFGMLRKLMKIYDMFRSL